MRAEYGESFKRHIKLCDETRSLRLDVRFPGEDDWETITPELAREVQARNAARDTERLKQRIARSSVDSYFPTQSGQTRSIEGPSLRPPLTGPNAQPIAARSTGWFDGRSSASN